MNGLFQLFKGEKFHKSSRALSDKCFSTHFLRVDFSQLQMATDL